MNRSAIGAVVALTLLLASIGVGYVIWASGRVTDDIAVREARALEAIEGFEAETADEAPNRDGTETDDTETDDSGADGSDPDEAGEQLSGDPIEAGSVVAIHRVPGDDYGRVVVVQTDGTRTLLERRCERLHVAADVGICVSRRDSFGVPTFTTHYLDASDTQLRELRSYASPQPSRARVSPEGTRISTTGFVSGSSYADIGGEAETLAIVDDIASGGDLSGLVQFEILSTDERYRVGGEYWGVSFVDEDNFWVTGFFGDAPEVLEGSVSRRVLTPSGLTGSCPSVSPDGATLVYKAMRATGDGFDLVAVDLASGDSWQLGESRSVDDQVEWLDNDTILYALHADSSEEGDPSVTQPQFDIWSLDIASGSEPALFLPAADSPAAVR